MSKWFGEGLSQLSKAAASAAEKAAAVKADAEAKLAATLNSADLSEQTANGVGHASQQPTDYSTATREDLIQLCTQRTQKLQQAMVKFRTLHSEYKRVQRDYESLQIIIRDDERRRAEEDASRAGAGTAAAAAG
eukprot:CAMPEP_0172180552 /NCGR_PEP_ID=MMETSP1050-20130122/17299_1 /TAXON_ID=233186 /ORGANISM="Cryptomonas curvata, Strain CCAP979/52" /LENGTH=133 /DNA_ID=CAMNT_0012853683 /DNA_START=90 /DNA_END=488 /DNA_ORIENTATION=-